MRENKIRDIVEGLEIMIGDIPYRVVFQEMIERFGVIGQTSFYDNKIFLDPNVRERDMLTSLFHEILEGVIKRYNLPIDHSLISVLEVGLFNALINNPDALQLFVDAGNKKVSSLHWGELQELIEDDKL